SYNPSNPTIASRLHQPPVNSSDLVGRDSVEPRQEIKLQQMAELYFFCLEIFFVVRIRRRSNRHLLNHFQPVAFQTDDLLRIVCEEPELPHAEIEQNLRAKSVIS